MKRLFRAAIFFCLVSSAGSLTAQVTTFAQFLQNGGGNVVSLVNNGVASPGGSVTLSATAQIFFFYQNVNGTLPVELQGPQLATLNMSLTSSTATTTSGGQITQFFPNTATISITRNTPYGGQSNLLTVNFSGFNLSGTSNGSGASGSASSTGGTVMYSSSFLGFSGGAQNDFGLSFSSVTPSFSVNTTNQLLNSFTAAITGTFSADPIPIVTVPEVNPSAILGLVVAATAVFEFGRQRRRQRGIVAVPVKDDEPALV